MFQQNLANRIYILGLQKVGKTTLLKRFQNDSFSANEKPTLGTKLTKILFDNSDFVFHDLGGQAALRKNWFSSKKPPNAIIYVVDVTSDKEYLKTALIEFRNVLKFYFSDVSMYSNEIFPPLLLLGNKMDVNEEISPYFMKEHFAMLPKKLNISMGLCSAKTGEGVRDKFKWLLGELVKFL
jgi:small GTP-binding protein